MSEYPPEKCISSNVFKDKMKYYEVSSADTWRLLDMGTYGTKRAAKHVVDTQNSTHFR